MSDLGLSADAQPTDDFATIPDVPIVPANNIVNPNQVRSGIQRGAPVVNYGADGNPQVLQGNQQTFGNGFYVAKPGVDVIQATDASQFIFNSGQDVFKIVKTITGHFPVVTAIATAGIFASNIATTPIAHGLTFTPAVEAYVGSGSSTGTFMGVPNYVQNAFSAGASAFWLVERVRVDSTNIYLESDLMAYGSGTVTGGELVTVYLKQETANPN